LLRNHPERQLSAGGFFMPDRYPDPAPFSFCTANIPEMTMAGEKRDFDAAAKTWDENPGRVKMAHDVAKVIRATVPLTPAMDVLDFGCGTGLLTLQLQPLVHSVTGADSSQGMIDILSAKIRQQGIRNVTARHVDLDKGGVLDGQYDLVVSSMTLHHVPEIQPLIDRFATILKPSGILAIADLDSDEGKFHESNEGVFHFGFDRCIMQKHFGRAGLSEIRNRTAAMMAKPMADGGSRTFTVFLMTGKKGAE
jgi:2-polyprenyl-3-methyl-5-hydroxy-6-metoxy-1,4-benzoquinol methylase